MRKNVWSYGGVVASLILVVFGTVAIVLATSGHSEVRNDIKREQIVGTPDMTPKAITAEAQKAGLKNVDIPSCSVANQAIDTGSKAKCFASYMRIHTLEATGGQTYAQMGRYMGKDGKATNDEKLAAVDAKSGKPVDNPLRNLWVTETALTTALHSSYFAESVATFAIVMGFALMLTGIGFLVVSVRMLRPAEKTEKAPVPAGHAVPAS
jgi:hypothetical protein